MDVPELLNSICQVWEKQFELCEKAKQAQFGKTAKQLWSFLGRSYREVYLEMGLEQPFGDVKHPWYRPRINKSAEFSDLMGAYVLSQLPHRNVTPRRPPIPAKLAQLMPDMAAARQQIDTQDQLACYLMEWWLNYASSEYDFKREARLALPEGFVKGRAVLWHEMVEAPAGEIPASRFVSVDDVGIDADTKLVRDAGFIYRRRERSVWRVSEETGIPREQLRALRQSKLQEATGGKSQQEQDICVYYEVYSRMGLGHWLDGSAEELKTLGEALDALGHNCYLEIMPGLGYPMNLNPAALTGDEGVEEMKQRLQWPIPFYADMAGNPWPASFLDLKPHQGDPWTSSPLEPGLPIQIFLDYLYGFIMSRIRVSSRNILVVGEALEADITTSVEAGFDLEIVKASGLPGEDLGKLMKFIEFPEINKDLWRIVVMAEQAFEKATGLEPLLYGSEGARQIRSAQEATIREAHASSRPDDYADGVEDWLSAAGAKEGLAARLFVSGETVAPLFGERYPQSDQERHGPMTTQWMELINTKDEYQAASEFAYTVAHGTARRKNKAKDVQDTQEIVQVLGQPLVTLAMAGVPGPFNAMVSMLGDRLERPLDQLMIPEGLQLAPDQVRGEAAVEGKRIDAEAKQAVAKKQKKD